MDPDPPALSATASRVIGASPQELHAFVSDLTRMGEISPETRSVRWTKPGRRFRGRNAIGRFYRWSMSGSVTENVPGEVFAFLTDWPSQTHWRYTFEPVDGGTLVTESMRKERPQLRIVVLLQDLAGARDRQEHLRAGMETTLARLTERFA